MPLEGDEIGRLIAHAVEGGITERRPWYDPSEIIDAQMNMEFGTLVVDIPSAQNPAVRGSSKDGPINSKRWPGLALSEDRVGAEMPQER